MRKLLTIFLFLLTKGAFADTFTVTTPVDNTNFGTLRWALQKAIDNHNGANYDTILFNIPSGNPMFRAIQLNSELPQISSYLIIDGGSQLQGAPFGVSDAKIFILPASFPVCKRGFVMLGVDHVEIYGLGFGGFINNDPTQFETWRDAIYMWNVHDIIIGAPTRGCAFTGNFHTIRHEAIPDRPTDPPPPGIGYNFSIQNNYIGKNVTPRPLTREGVVNAIELYDVHDVIIGGYAPHEENNFMVFLNCIQIGLKSGGSHGDIKIIRNNFIPGTTTIPFPQPIPLSGITVNENEIANPGNHTVLISQNDLFMVNTGISMANIKHPFLVVNNKINCNERDNPFPASTVMVLNACDSGLIGGQDSANFLHDAKNFGITTAGCKYIQISQNSIYCNPVGITINVPAITVPKINDMWVDPTNLLIGKTCAGCIVEVFKTAECPAQYYNGKTLDQIITADAQGEFNYHAGTDCFNTSFTVTDNGKTTSRFYVPNDFVVDKSGVQIQDATCGRSNGKITGIKIYSLVDFHWEDNFGITVGLDTNLINVPAGLYRLVATKQNIFCDGTTNLYQVRNIQPLVNAALVQLIHPVPQCNRQGSITGLIVTGVSPALLIYKWTNQLGAVVGNSLNLINVPAGTYRFSVCITYDTTCIAVGGPFTLVNKLAPAFDLSNLRLSDATCGKLNGAITGILILNSILPQVIKWMDATGTVVGTTLNLLNIGPGTYHMVYDDASPCPAITTPDYTILNHGLIILDETNKIIKSGGCTVSNGAITGISVTGASLFQWINLPNGNIIGNQVDLVNVPTGTYRLRVFDLVNGCVDSSSDITVPQTPIDPLTVQSSNVKDEFCSGANGSITNIILSPTPVGYSYFWIKNATDTFATTLSVSGLTKGDYQLQAKDINGCVQTVTNIHLADHPSPVINESSVTVTDEVCTQQNGSIKNITLTGGEAPYNYSWYYSPSGSFAGNGADLLNIHGANYFLVGTDKNNCKDTSSVVNVKNLIPFIEPPVYDDGYAKRNSYSFLRNKNGITGAYEIFDSPISNNPIESNTTGNFKTPSLSSDHDYWVERVKGSCRSARVKVHVYVIDYSRIYVPSGFTPNGDGLNDILRPVIYGKIIMDAFTVYNRWGQALFTTTEAGKGWDGTFKGKPQDTGTYTWYIQGNDIDGTPIQLRGTVTLFR